MDVILGIDLGTTNSEVAVIRDGQPVVLGEQGDLILPSVVGLDLQGKLLVGRPARNQYALAPERTVRSIKRQMGKDTTVRLGDQSFTPQEISAIILRALKARAEKALGETVTKAVITVPAFFNDAQREATRTAGELAGLQVVRIINEPTAAVLTYDPHPADQERLLVYDLGGGTFDVSIAQVEAGVVEILASHGDTQLGGDDFDQRLLNHVCDRFQTQHGIDLRESLAARSRLVYAVEEAKKQLSFEPVVKLTEEFIAENNGVPLNLEMEITRDEYEDLIEPLIAKTLKCVDDALTDAKLLAPEISRVILVGGATRTPLVRHLLSERLGRPVHLEVEPDLAVALGAAVQAGLIAGIDVGPILVDITPHTLGIATLSPDGSHANHMSPIIERNTPLPAVRTEAYHTVHDEQKAAEIAVYQGESPDVRDNRLVGNFTVTGLAKVPAPNQVLVRLELDLNGILRVTATEKATGLAKQIVVDNMMERFRHRQSVDAQDRLDAMFGEMNWEDGTVVSDPADTEVIDVAPASITTDDALDKDLEESLDGDWDDALGDQADEDTVESAPTEGNWREALIAAENMLVKAEAAEKQAGPEDAAELRSLGDQLRAALQERNLVRVREITTEIDDLVFYLSEA